MKKFFNVRLPLISACAIILGILSAVAFLYYDLNLYYYLAILPTYAVLIIILIFAYKTYKPLIYTIITAIFFLLGALCGLFYIINFTACEFDAAADNRFYICGTVEEKKSYENREYIILNNVYVDEIKIDGKVQAVLNKNYGEFCDIGYKTEFIAELELNNVFAYGNLNYNAVNNIKYSCKVYGEVKSQHRLYLLDNIRAALKRTLYENLDFDTASVCYAMLTGNTLDIENSTLESFRYGGIAHIFAVSGLHIGIIFAILNAVFKRLNANKYLTAIACISIIFIYSGVCGFTPSSVRAAVMCTVATICKLFYFKYDGLNALSFAVIILLFINPLNLFSVGFQLSVCAVMGICVFSKHSAKNIQKLKIPKFIASSVSVSLSAQAGTLPIMLSSFGYISGAGFILNIIVIPIISQLFVLLFVCTLLCAAITPLSPFLLPFATAPLDALISFFINAGFEKALISGFGSGLFIPIYFTAILFLSDKLNLNFIIKLLAAFIFASTLTGFVIYSANEPFSGHKIIVSAHPAGGEVIFKSSEGNVLLLTEDVNHSSISQTLNKYYSSNLFGIIILGDNDCVSAFGKLNVKCKNLYIFNYYIPVQPYRDITVHYVKKFDVCGVNFEFIDGYNIAAECNGIKIGVSANRQIKIDKCDLLISQYYNQTAQSEKTIYFNLKSYLYNVYDSGDFIFNAKEGKLFNHTKI